MTLTLRGDHIGAVVLAACALTATVVAVVTGRDRRHPALLAAAAGALGAAWATVVVAFAGRGPVQGRCPRRARPRARAIQLISFVDRTHAGIEHPAALLAAGFVIAAGAVVIIYSRQRARRQLGGAAVMAGVALGWLCLDSQVEGPIVVRLMRDTGRCSLALPHGIVVGDLVALIPLAGAVWLAGQALKPWRWAHSSAPVVAQS